jgi:hypothetical protein
MLTDIQIARHHYVVASYVKFQEIGKNSVKDMGINSYTQLNKYGIAVAQCLWCCATNRKDAGSIPYGVIGIFY